MRGLIIAIQFLSCIPAPNIQGTKEDLSRCIGWFPVVGLIIGGIVGIALSIGNLVSPWVGALLGLCAWTFCTGALHLDGLGDIVDAAGAAHKGPERIHEVLKDPHSGSFGVVAIGLQLLSKLVLLHELGMGRTDVILVLLLIPAIARFGPLIWARSLPPMHAGLGSLFSEAVTTRLQLFWTVVWAVVMWLQPAFVLAPVIFLFWHLYLKKTFQGINGDGFGAGIEITETLLLLATLFFVHG